MRNELPAGWTTEITAWTTVLNSMRQSPETIALRVTHVRRLGRETMAESPWLLTAEDLIGWTGTHAWSRETARSMRSSLKRFWAWGVETGRVTENYAERLPRIRPDQPRPRPAEPSIVRTALGTADARVRLMIRLANELGMRRGEVASVRPVDDVLRTDAGWSLRVHGKGARVRILPLPDDLAAILARSKDGYLFPSPNGGHLSAHWIGTLVSRSLSDGTTMHQLRHLCATEIHNETHDIRVVQTVLGHASLATTERYVAVDNSRMRAAIVGRSRAWSRG